MNAPAAPVREQREVKRLACTKCKADMGATLIAPAPTPQIFCDRCLARVLIEDPESPVVKDGELEGQITIVCRVCDKTIQKGRENITSSITCAECFKKPAGVAGAGGR